MAIFLSNMQKIVAVTSFLRNDGNLTGTAHGAEKASRLSSLVAEGVSSIAQRGGTKW